MRWRKEAVTVPFSVAMDDVTAGNAKVMKRDFLSSGSLAIVDQGQTLVAGYTNDISLAFKGDLPVIVFGDHTCTIKYVDFPFALGADGVRIIAPRKGYDAKFLYYYLLSSPVINTGYSRHFKYLRERRIPFVPLSEQRRIVEILDQADALRKKRAVADAKAARILPALFYKMFGDPATNPKGWPKKHLSDLCAQVTDGTHDTPKPTSSGYPLVTNAHFINGYIDFSQTYNISPEDHAAVIARSKPEYGDVLYSQIGSLGTACFVDTDREFSIKNCALFKPNPQRLSGKWLTALLNTESYKTYVLKQASGGLQKYLSLKVLRGLDVIAPPIAEQAQFDRAYDSVLALAERREESAILVNKLFNSILHRAFTGDLTAKWREAHMKELLQEMEQQAKALKIDDFQLPIEGNSKSSIINHQSEIPHD